MTIFLPAMSLTLYLRSLTRQPGRKITAFLEQSVDLRRRHGVDPPAPVREPELVSCGVRAADRLELRYLEDGAVAAVARDDLVHYSFHGAGAERRHRFACAWDGPAARSLSVAGGGGARASWAAVGWRRR